MNKSVEWSDELSVGIQEIDEQHKILANLVNRLADVASGDVPGKEHGGVDQLSEYARIHFSIEESFMRALEYPAYESHKLEHEKLMTKLKHLQQNQDADLRSVQQELARLITDHIIQWDRRYGPHFLRRGIAPSWKNTSWVERLWRSRTAP